MWLIQVGLSDHAALRAGVLETHTCNVSLSSEEFPERHDAEVFAALFAMSMHDSMPVRIETLSLVL
jgi:hypothetical protein